MQAERIPLRWPASWSDVELLRGSLFNCVVAEGAQPAGLRLPPGVLVTTLDRLTEVTVIDGIWPAARGGRRQGEAEAGPTGRPWVDANGWKILLERARNPGRTLWLTYDDPARGVMSTHHYLLAVADAEAYGARWVVSLDEDLQKRLLAADQGALHTWRMLSNAVRFFAARRDWQSWEPVASVGVLSTFRGPDEFLGLEMLNLAARRGLPVRVLDQQEAGGRQAAWKGLKAIVHITSGEPAPAVNKQLWDFVGAGGLLVTALSMRDGSPITTAGGYRIYRRGEGRIAIPESQWSDPWLLAADVHLLLGREHDVLRLYNAGTMNAHYTHSPDGSRGLVHLLGFALPAHGQPVTLALARRWRAAWIHTFEAEKAARLELTRSRFGVEIAVPSFSTYAAIELEA